MPNYKEVDGVRYQVVNNTFLGSNLIPVDAGGSLPEVDGSDNGKVLTVVAGEWDAAAVPKELPSVAGNAGKVLTVNSGATGTEWKDAPSGLPAVTIDDAGDVLTVNASGEWEAAAPSGGGGITMLAHVTNTTSVGGYTQVTLDTPTSDIFTHLSNGGALIIEYNGAYYHLDYCDLSTPWDEGVVLHRLPYVLKNESTGELYINQFQYIGYEGTGEDNVYGNWWYTEVNRGTNTPG